MWFEVDEMSAERLSALAHMAGHGELIMLTKGGAPVARLVGIDEAFIDDRDSAAELRELRAEIAERRIEARQAWRQRHRHRQHVASAFAAGAGLVLATVVAIRCRTVTGTPTSR